MSATGSLPELSMRQSARTVRPMLAATETLRWAQTISLPDGPAAIMDCLRRLGCLVDWWPGARALQALPGGLCQPGDVGLLDTVNGDLLLRVLAFRPRRLVLALEESRSLIVVDLALRELNGACTLTLRLERPAPGWPLADQWAALRLARLGRRAVVQLEAHLRRARG